MSLTRRGFLGLLAASALATACTATAPAPTASTSGSSVPSSPASASAAAATATIGLTYVPNIQFSPFYVAADKGLYAERGVTATLRHHGAAEGLFTALVAGQEDFVVAGADEMLQARAQGMDLVAIAQFYRQYPVVAIVPASSSIVKPEDLRGRTIGVPGKFGESWIGLQMLLKTAGLSASEVTIQDTQFTQQAALLANKVDAIMGFSNGDVPALRSAGLDVRTLPIAPGSVPLVSISLITTRQYLDAHPDVAKAVVAGSAAGFTWAAANPAETLTLTQDHVVALKSDAKALASAKATLEATIPLWKDASGAITPRMDPAQFAAMASFMKDAGLISAPVDATQAMSNDFLS